MSALPASILPPLIKKSTVKYVNSKTRSAESLQGNDVVVDVVVRRRIYADTNGDIFNELIFVSMEVAVWKILRVERHRRWGGLGGWDFRMGTSSPSSSWVSGAEQSLNNPPGISPGGFSATQESLAMAFIHVLSFSLFYFDPSRWVRHRSTLWESLEHPQKNLCPLQFHYDFEKWNE